MISGCVGPRGDGYNATSLMSIEEAESYHVEQIGVFERALDSKQPWAERVRGLRANASRQSHAELKRRLPRLNVMGGCCGTDHRHVEQIATACVPLFR